MSRRRQRLFDVDDIESFGDLGARASVGSRVSSAPQGYVDNRLRGIHPDTVGLAGGRQNPYDTQAAILRGDPNRLAVRQASELGNRIPVQLQSPSAQAGMPSVTGVSPQDQAFYSDLHSEHAVNPSHSVSGQRETQWGTFGARTEDQGGWWDARRRFGYGQLGARDAGYSSEYDNPVAQERTAGRLETTTTFDQEVMPHRPYLHLRARGTSVQAEGTYAGNAIMRVIAGNFQHGAQEVRRFWIGGGILATFDLRGWDNVRIELEQLMDDTFVEFAWTADGLMGNSRWLLFPDAYTTAATTIAVPDGAYAVAIESPTPGVPTTTTLQWTGRRPGNAVWTMTEVVGDPTVSNLYYGQPIDVKAPTFRLSTSGDILWYLRPI